MNEDIMSIKLYIIKFNSYRLNISFTLIKISLIIYHNIDHILLKNST